MLQQTWRRAAALALATVFVGAACAPGAAPGASPGGATPGTAPTGAVAVVPTGTVTVAQGVDVATLDPNFDTIIAAQNVLGNVFDPLVSFGPGGELEPALATSWKITSDRTYEFQLRKNVKFHDGTPFTAKDVKFTLDRILDPALKSKQRSYIEMIAKVEAPDESTVRVALSEPHAPFLRRLAIVYVVSADHAAKVGADAFAKNPIGTGPYKFVEWVKDQRIVMEANKDYWRGVPKIGKVTFKPIREISSRIAELRTGAVDIAVDLPPDQFDLVRSDTKLRVEAVKSVRTGWLTLNTREKPLDDPRVRQALNYGVNVDSIIKNLFKGAVQRATGPYTPVVFGYDKTIEPYPYDPERAKALLKEAGYPNGLKLKLETPIGRTLLDKESAEVIATDLAKIGVTVEVVTAQFEVFFERFLGKKMTNLAMISCGNVVFDVDFCIGLHFDSPRRGLYYSTPEMDRLIQEAKTTVDESKRVALYKTLLRKLTKDDAAAIWLWDYQNFYGVNNRVVWSARPDEQTWMYEASLK